MFLLWHKQGAGMHSPSDEGSYLEHVLTDHVLFLQTLYDIFRESDDAEAVRLAAGALMSTKTGRDYITKQMHDAHTEGMD